MADINNGLLGNGATQEKGSTGAGENGGAADILNSGASQSGTQAKANGNDAAGNGDDGGMPTVENLMAQLAQAKADNARLKTTNDKIMSENGGLRKSLKAKQTAEEQEAEAKAEAAQAEKERVAKIENELKEMKATNRYLKLGLSEEEAAKVAKDEVSGDMEAWHAGISSFIASLRAQIEKEIRADLLKQMPIPQSGNDQQIDFSAQINAARESRDSQALALAILQQAEANKQATAS